jgi:Ca2+-binding RTX toxin-like protein
MEGDSGTPDEWLGGNDLVNGRGGFDTIVYWRAVSGITADLRVGTVIDGLGNTDTLISIEAIDGSDYGDVIISGTGSDSLSGRDGDDTLNGNEGHDTLIGGTGDDSLLGGAGNDVLSGGEGNNALAGGLNDDTYVIDNATDTIVETLDGGKDTVKASVSVVLATNVENLTLTGTAEISGRGNTLSNLILGNTAANLLVGGGGNDTLVGDAGDDTLEGAAGNDSLVGGDGADTATYASAGSGVTVSLLTTTAQNTIGAGTDTLAAIENIIGSGFSDTITGSAANNLLMGGGGNDKLTGDAGNDILDGGIGNDILTGGIGTDTASYASSQAAVTVNLGVTTAQNTVGAGRDTLATIENVIGSDAGDTLTGSTLANQMDGGLGNDILTGGAGVDTLDGGAGSDIYMVALIADKTGAEIRDSGLSGTDELRFTGTVAGTLVIAAGDLGLEQVTIGTGTGTTAIVTGTSAVNVNAVAAANGLTIIGNAGTNTLSGSGFADRLDGGVGNDTLVGGDGADTLVGGVGNDNLTGGLGADVFVFNTAPNASTNKDTITDFSAADDDIWLAKAVMAGLGRAAGALEAKAFWGGADITTSHDANDRVIYNQTTGALFYDADGTGAKASVQIAQLAAGTILTASDVFIF